MKYTTDFEGLPLGPVSVVQLAAPPGVNAVLVGNMEVIGRVGDWPADPANKFFGDKALHIEGEATVMISGAAARSFGFAAGIRTPGTVNPRFELDVINAQNQSARAAALEFELNGLVLPQFGNFSVGIRDGRYGFGTLRGDVVGQVVIGD